MTDTEKLEIAVNALKDIVNRHAFRWAASASIALEALNQIRHGEMREGMKEFERNDSETRAVMQGLAPLFERADREGLWFRCHYQGFWKTPDELRKAQSEGHYIWGAVNWELLDPQIWLSDAKKAVEQAQKELESRQKKYDDWKAARKGLTPQ